MRQRSAEPSGHTHDHAHDHGRDANPAALTKALILTGAFLVVEVVGGILTGSLALLSDAAHMFTDTAALAIALAAIRIGERPADSRRTFGYQRFEILAAAVNAALLLGVALYILYEGYRRFVAPPQIQSFGMLAIAVVGLAVNLAAMRILAPQQERSVNVRGAYLEVWSDALGSLGVILAAVVLWLTGWAWVDTLVAVGIGLWVLPRAWSLLRETTNVLLEGVPKGIDLDEVANEMTFDCRRRKHPRRAHLGADERHAEPVGAPGPRGRRRCRQRSHVGGRGAGRALRHSPRDPADGARRLPDAGHPGPRALSCAHAGIALTASLRA